MQSVSMFTCRLQGWHWDKMQSEWNEDIFYFKYKQKHCSVYDVVLDPYLSIDHCKTTLVHILPKMLNDQIWH